MFKCLVNYNHTPSKEFVGDDYLIYDRSDYYDFLKDFDQSKIIYTKNLGQVDFDRLSYLVDNYDNLPDIFLWSKSNLFKSITEEEYQKMANNNAFTPLLTEFHKTYSDEYGVVCKYDKGIYWERADDWYFGAFQNKYIKSFAEWCKLFSLPQLPYVPFAPGGNYILTRETVHKHPKSLYAKMKSMLPYCREPVEAQCCERSYFLLWA